MAFLWIHKRHAVCLYISVYSAEFIDLYTWGGKGNIPFHSNNLMVLLLFIFLAQSKTGI